jgi:hypothetical protein
MKSSMRCNANIFRQSSEVLNSKELGRELRSTRIAEAPVTKNSIITRDDIDSMGRDEYDRRQNEQYLLFERLCDLVEKVLERFGRPDYLPGQRHGDFQVHCDYSEYPQVVVFVDNLKLLLPAVVDALQQLVKGFPGWHIDLMVPTRGHDDDWPNMGISIRAD